ncbi:MAG: MarR family transcriptional regulator [Devosia sp.]|uniref:MarR family winged helix-turn-helix transcriptional regulator n=1 Tax=Devosia sp. TaxID=1871048 RepID=UPI0024CBC9FF|nr:MarR family transcriptional regulator [Devosia sp.]UYN99037.1 MAG: MarR family transcriptional regulator [Devosia sp.]
MNDDAVTLDDFFPYQLAVAAEGFSRLLVEVYGRQYGLSREEWRLLFLLAEEKEVSSSELSRRTTLDAVQVSRASQRLQDKGLITRSVPAEDRRLRVYKCTKRGRSLFAEALPEVNARAKLILAELSEHEHEALRTGLAALTQAVQRVREPRQDDAV